LIQISEPVAAQVVDVRTDTPDFIAMNFLLGTINSSGPVASTIDFLSFASAGPGGP